MPSNFMTMDSDFPTFTGEESPKQQIQALHNYLYQLREGLQYSLRNLTAENFNSTALKQLTEEQKGEVGEQLRNLLSLISDTKTKLEQLGSRVASVENYGSRIGKAEEDIKTLQDATESCGLWQSETDKELKALEGKVVGEEGLETKVETLEEQISGEAGLQAKVQKQEDALTGNGGVVSRISGLEGIVRKQEDGSVAMGQEGGVLHLFGSVYLNGVLLELQEKDPEVPEGGETGDSGNEGAGDEGAGENTSDGTGETGDDGTGGTDSEIT